MTVAELLVKLSRQNPDATVYVQDPATDDPVPVQGLEAHQGSVVLTVEAE